MVGRGARARGRERPGEWPSTLVLVFIYFHLASLLSLRFIILYSHLSRTQYMCGDVLIPGLRWSLRALQGSGAVDVAVRGLLLTGPFYEHPKSTTLV